MTQEQIAELARRFIAEQGFKASPNVRDRDHLIVRIQTISGASVGSVAIPPGWCEWPQDAVEATVKASVLDSCAFAANEPALRAEQEAKRRA